MIGTSGQDRVSSISARVRRDVQGSRLNQRGGGQPRRLRDRLGVDPEGRVHLRGGVLDHLRDRVLLHQSPARHKVHHDPPGGAVHCLPGRRVRLSPRVGEADRASSSGQARLPAENRLRRTLALGAEDRQVRRGRYLPAGVRQAAPVQAGAAPAHPLGGRAAGGGHPGRGL